MRLTERRPKVPKIENYLRKLGALEGMRRKREDALRQKTHLESVIADLDEDIVTQAAAVAAAQEEAKESLDANI